MFFLPRKPSKLVLDWYQIAARAAVQQWLVGGAWSNSGNQRGITQVMKPRERRLNRLLKNSTWVENPHLGAKPQTCFCGTSELVPSPNSKRPKEVFRKLKLSLHDERRLTFVTGAGSSGLRSSSSSSSSLACINISLDQH
jgi:hypothetical protein